MLVIKALAFKISCCLCRVLCLCLSVDFDLLRRSLLLRLREPCIFLLFLAMLMYVFVLHTYMLVLSVNAHLLYLFPHKREGALKRAVVRLYMYLSIYLFMSTYT